MIFTIKCNDNEVNPFILENVTISNNIFYITGHSPHGCPTLLLSALWSQLSSEKALFSIIFISIGIVLCFFGNKIRRIIYFLDGLLAGFGVLLAILAEFVLSPHTDK